MWSGWAADGLVVVHLGFVVFVAFGGLLVWRWRRLAILHLPAAAWGVWIELGGGICPLTPLENRLRSIAGQEAYEGDFVGQYLLPVLYPEGLTREVQVALAAGVIALNLAIYGMMFRRRRTGGRSGRP
jgi:hypothetical protein